MKRVIKLRLVRKIGRHDGKQFQVTDVNQSGTSPYSSTNVICIRSSVALEGTKLISLLLFQFVGAKNRIVRNMKLRSRVKLPKAQVLPEEKSDSSEDEAALEVIFFHF